MRTHLSRLARLARRPSPAAAAFVAAVLLVGFAPRLYAQMRIGVVDVQRALVETEQGRRAKTQLKNLFQKRQQELDARQEGLKRLRDEIDAQHRSKQLDDAALARRMEDYQRQFVELQQNFMEFQQEIAQREAELTKQILVNVQTVIRQIGAQGNYTVIFEQGGIVWSPTNLDLTEQVVTSFNRQFPPTVAPAGDGGVAAPAAAGDGGVAAPARPAAAVDAGAPARPRVNPHPRSENQPPQR